jgi:imidazolonepropionase-like amidohydrolase
MVQAGMTPVEAIAAATLEPARFFGVDDQLGRVAPGYHANVVLVQGDPSVEIGATENIVSVWLDGIVLDRYALQAR